MYIVNQEALNKHQKIEQTNYFNMSTMKSVAEYTIKGIWIDIKQYNNNLSNR